jgi:ABC-2 type transport system permease protein
MFGWGVGLAISGMVLLKGMGAETFAWAAVFILLPVSGVYYPISVLPDWLQVVAWGLPPAYVFEGMRAVLASEVLRPELLAGALALSVVYLVIGFGCFLLLFNRARRKGLLATQGE